MGRTKHRGSAPPELAESESRAAGRGTGEPDSIGRYLARERKVREISLEELATLTRLPVRSLERLESGHLDGQHDGFTRGLVRTVSQALGLHVDDTLARMLPEADRIGSPPPRIARSLQWLGAIPALRWVVGAAALFLALWFTRSALSPPPEPLLYRQDAVRELWLRQQQHSSWAPAPALTTSPAPTVEPEGPRSAASETPSQR